jgi:hypothetical protein
MSLVIGLLRIIVGVIALVLTGRVYLEHRLELTGTKDIVVELYGYRFVSDPQLLVLGLIIGGLIGVLALCAGIYAVTHWPSRSRDDDYAKAAKKAPPKAAAPSDGAA